MAAPVNESGTGNESGEPELRPSDLPDTASLKVAGVCDKSPSEGEALEYINMEVLLGTNYVYFQLGVCIFEKKNM